MLGFFCDDIFCQSFLVINHLIILYIVDQSVIGLGFQELKLQLDKKEFRSSKYDLLFGKKACEKI